MKVAHKTVDASQMITIGPDHQAWKDPLVLKDLEGAFVRLDPPHNTPDEEVVRLRAMVVDEGAAAVKVLAVRHDAMNATAEPTTKDSAIIPGPLTARSLVESMVAESRTRDRELLMRVCESAMKTAGL